MNNIKILSIDVGIKNLALCLLEKKDDDFEIKKWCIINLNDGDKKCDFIKKNKQKCDNLSKFNIYNKDNPNDIFYVCNQHKKFKSSLIIPLDKKNKTKCLICEKEAKFCFIDDITQCWCDEHIEENKKKIDKKLHIKKMISITNNKNQDLSQKMYLKLDSELDFLNVDEVIIENQPSLRNPIMKTISAFIYAYFIMRGLIDKDKTNSLIKSVKFVSPLNKLKVDDKTTKETLQDKNKYKLTKNLGIKYCLSLINDKDKEILNKYKKKDDMCDCFLQGFHYLFSPISEKYLNKLRNLL